MSYKFQQVLSTLKNLTAESKERVAAGTRVVVMKTLPGGTVKVKVMDPKYPNLKKVRVIAGEDAFEIRHRGRPLGSGTKETAAVKDVPSIEVREADLEQVGS